jgi:hypothetical protein
MSVAIPALLKLRDEALNPSQDSSVRDIYYALDHHLHQVSVAKLVSDLPTDAENDDRVIKVAATKQRR